jgi:hypothetical protein
MTDKSPFPELYTIGSRQRLQKIDPRDEHFIDPRGLVCMWEPPNPRAAYVMGIDPTVGIVNWDRNLRTRDDYRTDNGAIEIIRVGKPDYQVCEYAAPIDPEDLADVANILGRMYCGREESQQALCIIEIYPGPGLLTQRKMINHHGYLNHFIWRYLDSMTPKATQSVSLGWTSSPKSVRDLWIRGTRHITHGDIVIRSEWLAEEMADCEPDPVKMTAKAVYGRHDDRVRAILMSIWAAHDWDFFVDGDSQPKVVAGESDSDWQKTDCTYDQMLEGWERRWDELSEGVD